MSKHDFLSAPKTGADWLDLRLGNPTLLQENYAKFFKPVILPKKYDKAYRPPGPTTELAERILALHKHYDNYPVTKKTRVVLGAGSSQVLQAAMHVMAAKEGRPIRLQKPYWARFNDLALTAGASLYSHDKLKAEKESIYLITRPNNPDGSNEPFKELTDNADPDSGFIFDLNYHWPHYYHGIYAPLRESRYKTGRLMCQMTASRESVYVFGLSKLVGLSSTRIGWALTENNRLADDLNHYIEVTSGGVSVEAQAVASGVIRQISKTDFVEKMGAKMTGRFKEIGRRFHQIYKPYFRNIKANHYLSGMFFVFRLDDRSKDFFTERKILGAPGEAFGLPANSIRINAACSEKEFKEFLKRISK